ncbi:MAG: glutamine synthetase [Oscillospiraceae bacterium]|nr:glutamine synthetase [Oscillospiraceae bacterium]
MNYTPEEVLLYVKEEDVKFIRMAFCDVYGRQKNVAIMADQLPRAFEHGIAIDASAIDGFQGEVRSDLFLKPDSSTLVELPWRPQQGRVNMMFCDIVRPDGAPFEADTRNILRQAVGYASNLGYTFSFGTEMEFYLFKTDENGKRTPEPFDDAGYMDIGPDDKGQNVRREICLTLEQMGILPEASHHESGPGQNEIDFRYAEPLAAADHAVLFRSVVKTIASLNGLWADFSPRPLPKHDGSGMHINISAKKNGTRVSPLLLIPGLMDKICEITLFLNPCENSYERLGRDKAPAYVTWSEENRSQLIRIPASAEQYRRLELRSPDSMANPYLAFALIMHACLNGIQQGLPLPPAADFNTFNAPEELLKPYARLPGSLKEAQAAASCSSFVRELLPAEIISAYCS